MLLFALLAGLLSAGPAMAANPYPTPVIADYVFGCMAANGQTQEVLRRCSCSIDVIASILPFERYEQAETVLRMRQVKGGGERMAIFRDTTQAKEAVADLKRAQTEAEVRCF
jgi:hypothetical protein